MPINRTWLTMTLKETPSGITGACITSKTCLKRNFQHLGYGLRNHPGQSG